MRFHGPENKKKESRLICKIPSVLPLQMNLYIEAWQLLNRQASIHTPLIRITLYQKQVNAPSTTKSEPVVKELVSPAR